MNTTALLVGSSGLVGKALQARLAESYAKVYAVSRKPLSGLPKNTENLLTDFSGNWHEKPWPFCDDLFCALGTTIRNAGSEKAFKTVDFDHVVNSAIAAKRAGATRMAVVSSVGASSKSSVFYSRTKGKMEESLKALGFAHLLIVRPSFLAGDRAALGQASRLGEGLALSIASAFKPIIPKKYRAISAEAVASCMVERLSVMTARVDVIDSDVLQNWHR